MTDLVTFLRARLDEDEWRAQVVLESAAKRTHYRADMLRNSERDLRDATGKRGILDLHVAEPGQHPDFCGHDRHELPCPTLRLLALRYADHQDYRKEWTP